MQFDGRTFILTHLANLKKVYAENQKRKAVPVNKKKGKSRYLPFFPNVLHSSSLIEREQMTDKDWREFHKV